MNSIPNLTHHHDQNSTLNVWARRRFIRSKTVRLPQKILAFPVISGFRRSELLSITLVTRIIVSFVCADELL